MLGSDEFPDGDKDVVLNAYHQAPFPEKYNDHRIKDDDINPEDYWLTEAEIPENASKKERKHFLEHKLTDENSPLIVKKYLTDHKIVAKWFNQQDNGAFDMSLITERGFYDASLMDVQKAKNTTRGISSLGDKGEGLIKNTFIVISKLKYISNETGASAARETALIAANGLSGLAATIAEKAADIAYNKARKRYSVWTTSYLYQLDWNEEIAAQFYTNYWMDKNSIDTSRKEAFENSDIFKFKFIGSQSNQNIILFTGGKDTNTTEKIITKATVRNIEKVFVKLQKTYDVFMPKTPLKMDENEDFYAEIGLKEGVNKKTTFEALELLKNELTGKTTFKKIGVLKVDKKRIWDDQFGAKDDVKNKTAKLKGT